MRSSRDDKFRFASRQQRIVEAAFRKEYDEVEAKLEELKDEISIDTSSLYKDTPDERKRQRDMMCRIWFSDLHNNITRIAIISRDKKLFNLTEHHPRRLLTEYAPDAVALKFMVDIYIEHGYSDGNGVPGYVWAAASLESAKILVEAWGEIPDDYDLGNCNDAVKAHFGWKPSCSHCGEYGCADPDCENPD